MKERLQIDQNRVFCRGDQVLVVEVRSRHGVQHRQVTAQTMVEASYFLAGRTSSCRHILHPAVLATVYDCQLPERGGEVTLVEPAKQFLKVPIDRERLGLVDD